MRINIIIPNIIAMLYIQADTELDLVYNKCIIHFDSSGVFLLQEIKWYSIIYCHHRL